MVTDHYYKNRGFYLSYMPRDQYLKEKKLSVDGYVPDDTTEIVS
jgi:hypothetical protein